MLIRTLQEKDVPPVLDLYHKSFPDLYPPFRRPALLVHPFACDGFDPEGTAVAEGDNGKVVGFALARLKAETSEGFLMTVFVDPEHRDHGIGGALLDRIEDYGRKRRVARIKLGPGPAGYFTLGVEPDSPGHRFLVRRGFREDPDFGYRPLWMKIELREWQMPSAVKEIVQRLDEEGIRVRISVAEDKPGILRFTESSFSDWHEQLIVPAFQDRESVPIAIGVKDSRVVAFTGPLSVNPQGTGTLGAVGVDPEFRGKGIARAVFNQACLWWRENGGRSAHLWTGTGNRAVAVYEEAGMKIFRTYIALTKDLV
jgi:GNAT superfamily N-acetyltransferase